MAVKSDYRVTDEDGELDDVSVSFDYLNTKVGIFQGNGEIEVSLDMVDDLIDALNRIKRDVANSTLSNKHTLLHR